MRFMMIVKANKEYEAGKPPDPRMMEAVDKHSKEMIAKGKLLLSGGLAPSSAGVRVNAIGGKLEVVDGPFAETKELVGGFAIMEAKSREEAVEMGKQFMKLHQDVMGPSYEGVLEIRQMFGAEDFPHQLKPGVCSDSTR